MSDNNQNEAAEPVVEAQETAEEAQSTAPAESTITLEILIPTQSFLPLDRMGLGSKLAAKDGHLEFSIAFGLKDAVQDLKQAVTDSPEGFWLAAHGFRPVVAELIPLADGKELAEGEEQAWGPWVDVLPPVIDPEAPLDPKIWRLNKEGVLGDFADLEPVFGGDFSGKKRGLRVVPTSFAPLSMNMHILRVRDTLYSSVPYVAASIGYDPTSIAIGAGSTLYGSVRGDITSTSNGTTSVDVDESEAERAAPSKSKKNQAQKSVVVAPQATPTPTPTPVQSSAPPHAFTGWSLEKLSMTAVLQKLESRTSGPSIPCLSAFGISPWSPPPHTRRMRGDIAYLTITTIEGESYHITGGTSGFWVANSSATKFDPLPRSTMPRNMKKTPYHSLFELFCALSPAFVQGLIRLIEIQNPSPAHAADVLATLPITHASPAAPWVVRQPVHTRDTFRTQLAYLLTSSTTAEQLPPARDWNDELCQFRELPQTTLQERILRERLIYRTQSDFVSAATRGVVSISLGDVPPLNPNEPEEGHTYTHNGMLFQRADDPIKAFEHIGGHEASRVAASKDIAGLELIERLDLDGLHSIATILVDYCGSRWIVQSIPPGLFKSTEQDALEKKAEKTGVSTEKPLVVFPEGDVVAIKAAEEAAEADKPFPSEETTNKDDYPPSGSFRIIYGNVLPEEPDVKVRASAYFHVLAKQVAQSAHLAEHTVYNRDGQPYKLWTSTDMHGVAAPDGRSYYLDCFRMHCVDIEFLDNIDAPLYSDSTDSSDKEHVAPAYPHRIVFLRHELLNQFRDYKLQKWIEERASEISQLRTKQIAQEPAAGSIELELKEAASDASASEEKLKSEDTRPARHIIDAGDFLYAFNPDAFVERQPAVAGETSQLIYDPEEDSTKAVRDASLWLRSTALPAFVVDVVTAVNYLTDGFFLSKLMHRKGINMRYLGILVHIVEKDGPTLEYGRGTTKSEVTLSLSLLKSTLQHEMVIRACKHILRRLLHNSNGYDHQAVLAHFLNCLLGAGVEPNPSPELAPLPEGVTSERLWASLTPTLLRSQIVHEVELRYRYTLPSSFFDHLLPVKVLRELSLRVGVQLALREYRFSPRSPAPNGIHTTDDEKTESNGETPVALKKKKNKKSLSKVVEKEKAADDHRTTTFHSEDVLNLMPVVRSPAHRSTLAEENFNAGYQTLGEGNIDLGQDLIQDALTLYEQVFGAVHPEAAARYHSLGLLYHTLAMSIMHRVQNHEAAEEALREMPAEAREETRNQLARVLLADVDAARAEGDAHLQAAVRIIRQSIIISERTTGIDSRETIQIYTDLGLLEQSIGNNSVAIRLTKHAVDLFSASYGPDHPSTLSLLSNAAAMIQSVDNALAGIPLLLECRTLTERIHGRNSTAYAATEQSLAHAYGIGGDLVSALPHIIQAHELFEQTLGPDAKETLEAAQFIRVLQDALSKGEQEQRSKDERLRRKFPRLMATKDLRTTKTKTPTIEKVVEPVVVKAHGQKSGLSVDELVNFIEGRPQSRKTKA